ncbi:MAG: hypothetical protein PHQ57_00235 [Candidatus Omnitrophica bacterium]|nr:hypothetical protein [Candidatus Omnitrophota bacterium]
MKKNILISLLFLILVFIFTFPLIPQLTNCIPGFFSTDEPFGAISNIWRGKYLLQNHLSLDHNLMIAYPFGVHTFSSGFVQPVWMALNYFLAIIASPILSWNIQIITNLFLSGFIIYMLVFYLTRSTLAGIFSGMVFAFCPYSFMRAWQHLGLTYNEWIPLCLLAAILLREKQNKKHILLFFASLVLLFSFDLSVAYLGAVSLSCLFIFILFYDWRARFKASLRRDFKYFGIAVITGLFALAITLLPTIINVFVSQKSKVNSAVAGAHNPYLRPFEDLFSQSARPLSYFLPASVHPVFGKFTENFVGSSWYGESFTEHTLYLGWVPLILAFLAFKGWKRRKEKESPYIGFFIFLAVIAWLFSQPPWWNIGSFKIYMPSFFMYKILPMFRAYCRFGIVVMLAVAVLAGFGLKLILQRFKAKNTKIIIAGIIFTLLIFEFWNYPPFKVINISKVPDVYYWLGQQPGDFVIAEYPLDIEGPNEMYKFCQTVHHKKMINGTTPGTYPNRLARTITKLSSLDTGNILKWMEVKFVLVHEQEYLDTELKEQIEELKEIALDRQLKLIKTFPAQDCPHSGIMCIQKSGKVDVYELLANPVEPKIE